MTSRVIIIRLSSWADMSRVLWHIMGSLSHESPGSTVPFLASCLAVRLLARDPRMYAQDPAPKPPVPGGGSAGPRIALDEEPPVLPLPFPFRGEAPPAPPATGPDTLDRPQPPGALFCPGCRAPYPIRYARARALPGGGPTECPPALCCSADLPHPPGETVATPSRMLARLGWGCAQGGAYG